MIVITNIRNIKPNDFDEVWAIVRSLKKPAPYITHVPELSPSWELFLQYRALAENGSWNQDAFEHLYKPRFLKQIDTSPAAQQKLKELIAKDTAGKKIALFCFCQDANTCHRSLISNILNERNVANQLS